MTLLRALVLSALLAPAVVACGGTPCDKAVDNRLALIQKEGSELEKTMAAKFADKTDAMVALCEQMIDRNPTTKAVFECRANAQSYAELNGCDKLASTAR